MSLVGNSYVRITHDGEPRARFSSHLREGEARQALDVAQKIHAYVSRLPLVMQVAPSPD